MGCTTSMISRPVSINKTIWVDANTKNSYITAEQRHLVKKTWRFLSRNMAERGTRVFLRIFELNPHVKSLFYHLKDKDGAKLSQDPNFQSHATRFMQTVGAVIDNIDNLDDALCPILIGLGRQHIHFSDFEPSYFDAFKEGMVQIWRDDLGSARYNGEIEEAWSVVFDFIMDKLKEGYALAIADQKLGISPPVNPHL